MSGNSSATGGYLSQLNTTPNDEALEDALHDAVVGILRLPNDMVRPRWQPTPPNQPPANVNWCAIGITNRSPTDYPVIRHLPGGPDRLTRWSAVTVLASFYGPNCQELADQMRDGLYIQQNLDQLATVGLKLTDAGDVKAVPDLVNMQWINRADMELHLAQAVDRDYNVLDIVSSQGTITTDTSDPGVISTWDTTLVINE